MRAAVATNFKLLDSKSLGARSAEQERAANYNAALTQFQNAEGVISQNGLDAIVAMAKSGCAPAQYSHGVWMIQGHKVPKDEVAGLKLLLASVEQGHSAALDGTVAQLYLGDLEVETNPDNAASYFRQCAGRGQSTCQTRLATHLLNKPRAVWPQAIAWLQLAAKQNHAPARKLLESHTPDLTAEERSHAGRLRQMLSNK